MNVKLYIKFNNEILKNATCQFSMDENHLVLNDSHYLMSDIKEILVKPMSDTIENLKETVRKELRDVKFNISQSHDRILMALEKEGI